MANIFNQATPFNGSASPTTGTGEVVVDFLVINGEATLYVYARQSGSTTSYHLLKTPTFNGVLKNSGFVKFDVTGLQYYFVAEPRAILAGFNMSLNA